MDFIDKIKKSKNYSKLIPEYRQLFENFITHLILQQFSFRTLQRKIYMINKFLLFSQKVGVNDMAAVTTDLINAFLLNTRKEISRTNRPVTASYLSHYYVSVKSFFSFLYTTGKILINPAEKIMTPKKDDLLPRHILNREEIERVLNQPDINTYKGLMARTILEVMYGCGLRTGEICKLEIEDIDLKSYTIHIKKAKNAQDRIIPIGEVAKSWVQRYLLFRRVLRPELKRLFLTDRDNKPILHDYVARFIREYLKKAEINKKIVPHSFRHTFATHLLEEGANLRHIQSLLGHSSLDSTQIYTHVGNLDLKKLHSLIHPREIEHDRSIRKQNNTKEKSLIKKGGDE